MLELLLSPALALSLTLATLYAALFHLWKGEAGSELALYWLASVIGFGLGQLGGLHSPFPSLLIGKLHVVEATLGAWLLLFVVKWLKL